MPWFYQTNIFLFILITRVDWTVFLMTEADDSSTASEKDFRRKYTSITHRMVHRKSSVEMFRRLATSTFGKSKLSTWPLTLFDRFKVQSSEFRDFQLVFNRAHSLLQVRVNTYLSDSWLFRDIPNLIDFFFLFFFFLVEEVLLRTEIECRFCLSASWRINFDIGNNMNEISDHWRWLT